MATFNTYVKLGTRGNSLLSFNLSGCTNSNTNSCTALPDYQDVLHTRFDGSGLYVTGLTLHSTYFIYVEANRQVLGSNCNPLLTKQMIPITGIPTPTPTPSPTPLPTATTTNTPTPTPTLNPCSFDGTVVYGLSGTAIPTATPTSSPATYTPTPTNTTAPAGATNTPTPTPIVFSVKYGLVSNGASAACDANNSLNITTNNGDFCSATNVYGVASLSTGLYFFVYDNQSINVNVTSLNNTGVVTSSGCEVCPDVVTQTPTNIPTPTATPIPYQLTVFTGNSLSTACSNLVNPLLEPTILFYQGPLGIGTILYRNNNYTNEVTPTVYCAADSETVYVVGTPSNTDGEITSITSCPAATLEPTPIPEPTTFDVYEKCSLDGTKYHVDYNVSNLIQVTINGFCCFRIDSNVSSENMTTNHNSSTYFSSFTNANCICD